MTNQLENNILDISENIEEITSGEVTAVKKTQPPMAFAHSGGRTDARNGKLQRQFHYADGVANVRHWLSVRWHHQSFCKTVALLPQRRGTETL